MEVLLMFNIITLWIKCQILHIHGEWNVLLFLHTNAEIDYQTLWDNNSYSNTTNVYLHQSTVQDLHPYQSFRSPLIESWQRLNVQRVKVSLYDSYGHDLISYLFDGNNTTASGWFSEPVSISSYDLGSTRYEAADGIIQSLDNLRNFWFLPLKGSLGRRHFVMFSPNDTTFQIPAIEPFCTSNYSGLVVASVENVTSYGACLMFCYGTVATTALTASLNDSKGTICKCLVNFTATVLYNDVNNTHCGLVCMWNSSVPCVGLQYSAVSNISSFEDHLTHMRQQTDTVTYSIFGTDAEVVDFGSKTVLTRITVTSNDGCHLSFRYSQGCNQTGGTDPVLTDAENMTVLTNSTKYVGYLAVKCIEMTNKVAGSFCRVIIETQTGSPSFAPVIAVSAFWQNEICQFANIMMPDLMTSSNVQLYHGELGDMSSRYAALRHTGIGLGLKLGSWPVPETRIFLRPADQYNNSILLHRIEIATNVTSINVKAVLCNNTNNIENSTLSFREEIENGAVTIWMSNDSTPLCILQVEISLPTLTSNDTSLKRSLRVGLFGCVNNSDTTCNIVDLFKEEYFPSNKITLYSEQEGTDMTSIGTCGEGLQIPVYDVLENPVFYIKLTQSPQIFVLVDRIMLLGASLTAYVSAAKRQYGVFEILNTTTFTSGVIAEFQTSIEVHTLQVSASHTDFKMEIWGCILNMEIIQNGNTFTAATNQCNNRSPDVTTKAPMSEEEAEKKAEEYRKILEVNHRTLSSFVRSKTSASDDRSSSKAIGTLGVLLLTLIIGFIVSMDIPRFLVFSRHVFRALKRKLAVNE